MSSNINVVMGLSLQCVNVAANVTPLSINLQGIAFAATVYEYYNFAQISTTGTAFTLPTSPIYVLYVRNLGANNVAVSFTPTGGSTEFVTLVPVNAGTFGGINVLFETQATAGGITALTLTAATATTPCEVFMAG